MDYLVDCQCNHDLTLHDGSRCRGDNGRCICTRTKLEALDAAIELARVSPWTRYVRSEPVEDAGVEEQTSA